MNSIVNNPVFICGLNRTGTTLLMALLDGHPQLVVAPDESHFFLRFLPQSKRVAWEQKLELAQRILLEDIDANNAYYQKFLSHIPVEKTHLVFKQLAYSVHDPFDLLPIAIHSYGVASNQVSSATRFWVEKTPGNELYSKHIYQHWPQAKCLHLVRDPRDVFASNKLRAQRKGSKLPSAFIFAIDWMQSISSGIKNQEMYGDQRYIFVRYETLVKEPENIIQKIIKFLGIDSHPILYAPTKGGGQVAWQGNAVDRKFNQINASVVDRWKEVLNQKEINILESVLANDMKKFNYLLTENSSSAISISAKVLFWPYLWLKRNR